MSSISAVQDATGLSLKANYLRSQDFIGIANVILDNKTLDINY